MNPSMFPGWTPLSVASGSQSPGAGPSSPVAPLGNGVATATTTNASRLPRKQRRWPQEVYDFLSVFFLNDTQYPKKQQREELAQQIRQTIPGCETYTQEHVYSYFATKRQNQKVRTQNGSAREKPMTSAHILYPSLAKDPQIIPKLEILLKDISNPTLDVAVIWAEKLGRGVKAADILTYARLRFTQQGETNPNTASVPTVSQFPHLPPFQRSLPLRPPSPPQRPRSQLPTPASSISPEPRSPASDARFKPVLARPAEEEEEDDEEMKDELELDEEEMDVEEEPISRPTYEIRFDEHRLNDLATSLHAVLSQPPGPPPSGNIPKTYADLSRWLGQESQVSIELLKGIERGVYAPLGMGPSPSSPSMAK